MPTHKDIHPESEAQPEPRLRRLAGWLRRNARTLTSASVVGIIACAALVFILIQRRQRESAAMAEAFSAKPIPRSDREGLGRELERLERLAGSYRDTKAYPLIRARMGAVLHRLGRYEEAESTYMEALERLPTDHPLRSTIEEGIDAVRADAKWYRLEMVRLRAEVLLRVHPIRALDHAATRALSEPWPRPDPSFEVSVSGSEKPVVWAVDPERAPALAAWLVEQAKAGALDGAAIRRQGTVARIRIASAPPADAGGFEPERGSVAVVPDPDGRESELWLIAGDPGEMPEGIRAFGRLLDPDAFAALVDPGSVLRVKVSHARASE